MATHKQVQRHKQADAEVVSGCSRLDELLADVNPECANEIRAIYGASVRDTEEVLQKMWRIGKRAESLRTTERYRRPKDADAAPVDPVAKLAQALEYSRGYLERMMRLYRAFPTQERIDWLSSLRMADSARGLSWRHMEELLQTYLEDDAKNERFFDLIERTLENDWSPDAVSGVIGQLRAQSKAGKPPRTGSSGAGRPVSVPTSLTGRLGRFTKQSDQFLRCNTEVYAHPDHNFLKAFDDLPHEKVQADNDLLSGQVRTNRERIKLLWAALQAADAAFATMEVKLALVSRETAAEAAQRDLADATAAVL